MLGLGHIQVIAVSNFFVSYIGQPPSWAFWSQKALFQLLQLTKEILEAMLEPPLVSCTRNVTFQQICSAISYIDM